MADRIGALTARLAAIGDAADQALADVTAIEREQPGDEASHWLPGLRDALERIRLECADARFAARALRDAQPGSDSLQPRLF
jgi:hypothetical protein